MWGGMISVPPLFVPIRFKRKTNPTRTHAMTKPPSVTLLATERQTLKSDVTGKEYEISIALPYTYEPDTLQGGPFSRSLAAYPVVYLTDSNWHFGMVTDMVREMAWCGRTLDAIVVGIGYPEADSPQESWRVAAQFRADDLTPIQSDTEEKDGAAGLSRPVKTGGGGNFLAFLKTILIPHIERQYKADPARRILVGHSYGGLFALFALLRDASLFRTYISASPYLRRQDPSIFTIEREYAAIHSELEAQLYLAAGDLEESVEDTTLTDMYRLAAILKSRNYSGFSLTTQLFADNNHCEVVAPALHAGLKMALKR
jgi:predicted alpha/beta superfamily hydrolase